MTLQASGTIKMSNVNTELELTSTARLTLGSAAVRELFEKPSGRITMSNGYGKSNVFYYTFSTNATNVDLSATLISAGWNADSEVVVTINSGVYISGTSTSNPALLVTNSFPKGITLNNNGYIIGMGGAGGNGSNYYSSGGGSGGTDGGAGGTAFKTLAAITVVNNGTIAGGGGGGGGGRAGITPYILPNGDSDSYTIYGGSGGGGQGGLTNSATGSPGGFFNSGNSTWLDYAYSGTSGTNSTAGTGGGGRGRKAQSGELSNTTYSDGGAGGGWGAAGTAGRGDNIVSYGSRVNAGGAAGKYVEGNSFVTWSVAGTRLGGVA